MKALTIPTMGLHTIESKVLGANGLLLLLPLLLLLLIVIIVIIVHGLVIKLINT